MVFAARGNLQERLPRTVSTVVTVDVPKQLQTRVASAQQAGAMKEHSLSPRSRAIRERQCGVGNTIGVLINQNPYISRT
jgi:hypothetical protein